MSCFVGRDSEIRQLSALLNTTDGSARLICVSGPEGVGKSALLRYLLRSRGLCVMWAQAVPWESDRVLAVARQLGPIELQARTDWADLLAQRLAAERTAIVVVEDAQWADIESLRVLSTVARADHAGGIRVIFSFRDGAELASETLASFFRTLSEATVVLARFDGPATAELAAATGVALPPVVAARLAVHTGGTPRHIIDLLSEMPSASWVSTGRAFPAPRAMVRRLTETLTLVSTDGRRFVEAAAVLAPAASFADVAAVAQLQNPIQAFDDAESAGLINRGTSGQSKVDLVGSMVRQAILELMGPAGRSALHERAAEAMRNPVDQLRHRAEAALLPDPALADGLDRAATVRATNGNWAEVAQLLTSASALTSDLRIREERVLRTMDALIAAGDTISATALMPEVDSYRETPLKNAVLGYLAVVRGRSAEAGARLARAWELVNTDREPSIAALISQRFVLHSLAGCRPADLVTWADRAVSLAPPNAPEAIEARAIYGLGIGGLGRTAEAINLYDLLAKDMLLGPQAQRVVLGRGWLQLAVDAIDEARASLESGLSTDFLGGSLRISLWAHGWLARVLFLTGKWDEALATALQGTELAESCGMALLGPLLWWTPTQIYALRGEAALAEKCLRKAEAGALDYSVMFVPSVLARAHYAEATADYRGVIRALAPLATTHRGGMVDEPGFWPWADIYANALVMEGQYEEAEVVLKTHEDLAAARGHRSASARLGLARGRLHGAHGDLELARGSFEQSLALLADLPLEYDRARVNFVFGQTLRRAGKRREAEAVLATARRIFASLGATTYVERCDRELNATGLGVRTVVAVTPLTPLTPQEQLVAELVAHGRSNKEVATELFISMKTVQFHLTRIYAKVGVRSRSELAATWEQGPASSDGVGT